MLKIPMCELIAVRQYNFKVVSADEPNLETEEPMELKGDLQSIEDILIEKDNADYIKRLMKKLPLEFRKIVSSYFGIGTRRMTTFEIAREFGCTQQSISEKRKRAIQILRKNIDVSSLNY